MGTTFLAATNTLPASTALVMNLGTTVSLNPTLTQFGVTAGNYNQTVALLAGDGTVLLGSATLTVDGSANGTFADTISGSGGLTKAGSGTLSLASPNSHTGPTTISGGALTLVANGSLSNASSVINNSQLRFVTSFPYNFSNNISGIGSLSDVASEGLREVGRLSPLPLTSGVTTVSWVGALFGSSGMVSSPIGGGVIRLTLKSISSMRAASLRERCVTEIPHESVGSRQCAEGEGVLAVAPRAISNAVGRAGRDGIGALRYACHPSEEGSDVVPRPDRTGR